jgi:hypothetical protein
MIAAIHPYSSLHVEELIVDDDAVALYGYLVEMLWHGNDHRRWIRDAVGNRVLSENVVALPRCRACRCRLDLETTDPELEETLEALLPNALERRSPDRRRRIRVRTLPSLLSSAISNA